jgi:gliding motility-associated-like protein
MKRRFGILILLYILGFCQSAKAQNLVPDGTFSIHNNVGCPPVYVSLQGSPYWYAAGNTTVDFYLPECDYSTNATSGGSPFWNYPYYGNGFIGFWGVFRSDFTMGSEVFGTVLTEVLKPNQAYYFTTDIRYRGKDHPIETIFPLYCPSNPPLALQIYTSTDTVRSDIDMDGAARQVFANNVLTLDSPAITDTVFQNDWTNIWGCFRANGGEKHLGFSLTIDSFSPVSPCVGTFPDAWISMSYYNLDNIKLIPFPNQITDTLLLCKEKGKVEFDAKDYFGTIDITKFQPIWSDGTIGTKRTFTEDGFYNLILNYECGNTEFEIFVNIEKCEAAAFVPNAFTPNFDGHNDELLPFFSADFPITNYEFMVFDRWGNIFYKSENYDGFTGWDGTVNGKAASNSVYVWALKFDLIAPDKTKHYQLSGDVLLVR